MKTHAKKVLLIVPSKILARGMEAVLSELGEFRVAGILTDLSHASQMRLRNIDADVIVLDPVVFDFVSRSSVRSHISEYSDAAVVGLQTIPMDDEQKKQYDALIGLNDDPVLIVRKLRESLDSRQDNPETEEYDLSAREKEILVCVAKGMLNKEIADACNLSIHPHGHHPPQEHYPQDRHKDSRRPYGLCPPEQPHRLQFH